MAAESSDASCSNFTLLSWNIDGLDERDTIERTQAVCLFISTNKPHAVFLQEVIPSTEQEILKKLGADYDLYSPPFADQKYGYYVTILILKTKHLLVKDDFQSVDLPETRMGRHVICCSVIFRGVEIELYTAHLESRKGNGEPRKVQLAAVFDQMSRSKATNMIFGGDLNLRDNEVKAVGIPENTVDVWESCGADKDEEFTWDITANDNLDWSSSFKPKCRFDRVYLSSIDGKVRAKSFRLVGKERLPVRWGRFPSDHWGLWMEFTVDKLE